MKRFLVHIFCFFFMVSCSERKVYIIDGAVSSKEEFENLDNSDIFSIKKLDPNKKEICFPDSVNKGSVVIVTTRKTEEERQRQRHALLNMVLDFAPYGNDLLIIKNGIIYPQSELASLRNLASDQLSNTMLMAEKDARLLYGSVAKSITLVINTYQPEDKQESFNECKVLTLTWVLQKLGNSNRTRKQKQDIVLFCDSWDRHVAEKSYTLSLFV